MSVFEVMKQLKLLNWYTLLVGLEREWCKKENLIDHCEEIINQQFEADIDNGLITVIAEKNRSTEDLIAIYPFKLKSPISRSHPSTRDHLADRSIGANVAKQKSRFSFQMSIVLQLLKNKKKPLTLEKKIEAVEKWLHVVFIVKIKSIL